ncbi:MAG: S-layer homology domain-containing protein [Clostridia bacterium]|nr:S-layer homology domain-containing protein [Clostridia bacterium]
MKTIKRTIAVLLALMLLSASLVCFAADGEKEYYNYEKVLLLGDSEASGFTDYGDEMSEFTRVDDSYAAYVADDLGAELLPMACPGFRTIELRTMLDDSYIVDDPYLFTEVPRTSEAEIRAKIPEMRQNIKDADMIVIGIGGNDWGAYLGWTLADVQLENELPEEYKTALREYLVNASFEDDIIGQIIYLADYLNAVDEIIEVLPEAAAYAFGNLETNWKYIVEYIYENNPDVTLVAVGMFPTYLKTEEGAPDVVIEPDAISAAVEDMMIEFGNRTMVNNQEKYGYIYVDTAGTVVETCHPTKAGHRHIADRILEALPDARFNLTDVKMTDAEYKAVEYMYVNGYMTASADKKFNGDTKITKDEYSATLKALGSAIPAIGINNRVSVFELKLASFLLAQDKSMTDVLEFIYELGQLFSTRTAFDTVTKTQVAVELYNAVK